MSMGSSGCSLNIVFFPQNNVICLNPVSSAATLVFYLPEKTEKGQSLEYFKKFVKNTISHLYLAIDPVIYLSIYLSTSSSLSFSATSDQIWWLRYIEYHLSIYLFIYISICLSFYLYVYLSIYIRERERERERNVKDHWML